MSNFASSKYTLADRALTAAEQLRNVVHALLDGAIAKRYRVTDNDREWLEGLQQALNEARVGEPEAKKILQEGEDRFRAIVGKRMTKKEMDHTRDRIKRTIEEREARLDWEAGGQADWSDKAKKHKPPGSGYVM